ncbi:cold-shock protein [Marinilongibacter aquaticus]|uniref:cold-shock protein n=1 Tax=Marinilongibacter aquaticus TaxID=2975157 RepID=UPI00286EA67E|nr:cold shock domain-containing protein [Marinilongibacter aquaticus]
MKEGVVKFFNYQQGLGFIEQTDPTEDIFVHESGLVDDIKEHDKVEYDIEQGKKWP